jgi:hypothetical protein
MTNQEHPITPPPELWEQWYASADDASEDVIEAVATQAARWGADQELEACCEWLCVENSQPYSSNALREYRRPKPPSLKEQALAELELLRGDANAHGLGFDAPAILRALEQLND